MKYFIEGIKQDDSQVEDVDIIVDDSSPDIIDVDTKSDTVDDDQLCFGTASLDPFHYNMCKNTYGQDGNEMIDIIILGEKYLDYIFDENNNISIAIIETFLVLLNHSLHNDNRTFIQSNFQGEIDLK